MAGDESGVTLGQPHLAKQDLSTLVSPYILSVSGAETFLEFKLRLLFRVNLCFVTSECGFHVACFCFLTSTEAQ